VNLLQILLGIFLLSFGRKAFWLFAGSVGFFATYLFITKAFSSQPEWLLITIAAVAGLVGALLAVYVQSLALGLVGIIAGAYVFGNLSQALHIDLGPFTWFIYAVGGLAGGFLVLVLLDWALIFLSSYLGSTLVAQSFSLVSSNFLLAFILLFILGVLFQVTMLRRDESTPTE
jgi:hypothetical protein